MTLTINSDGGPIFGIAEGFFHGDLGYDLLWMSPVGSETADTATFQQIVDSCKFIE